MGTIEGFQQKEEVEEYLQNLGIEYRFQCYSEKRADGCHRLGEFLESVRREFEKAATVFQENCDVHNWAKSCFRFGNLKIVGRGTSVDGEMAAKYHKRACASGHPVACYQYAMLRKTGSHGAELHPEEVEDYLKKGCELNDSESCFVLSTLYLSKKSPAEIAKMSNYSMEQFEKSKLKDEPMRTEEDEKIAYNFTKRACDLNHIYACVNLHQMYTKGYGCEIDEQQALDAKRKALALKEMYSSTKNPKGVVFGEG